MSGARVDVEIDVRDGSPIDSSTDEQLKQFINKGVSHLQAGQLMEYHFEAGIRSLYNKFTKGRIDKILLDVLFEQVSKNREQKSPTAPHYAGESYNYVIYDKLPKSSYIQQQDFYMQQQEADKKLMEFMEQYSYKQFDNFFPSTPNKNIDTSPQINYNNQDTTLETMAKGERDMRGIHYLGQAHMGRRQYTHMRAMLQKIWDIQYKYPGDRFDIDQRFAYNADQLKAYISSNASHEEIDLAHRSVVETYKSRGRPPGARNRDKVVSKDFSALDSILEDVLIDENTKQEAPKPAKDTIEATLLDVSEFVTHPQLDSKTAELRTDMRNIANNITNALIGEYTKLEDKVNSIQLHTPTLVEIKRVDLPPLAMGVQHRAFPLLLKACSAQLRNGNRIIPWVYGPAGTGKSTAAENVAIALGLDYYSMGKTLVKFEVVGFINTSGYQTTEFRKAYEFGGVFCADEMDAWSPEASVAINGALANGHHAFPDKTVKRHLNFVMIACANTVGAGATLDYVGRSKQDAATLDRFVGLYWPLDEALEASLCANNDWLAYVRHVRQRANASGINPKPLVTPRATIHGEALLAAGIEWEIVVDMCLRKGLSDAQWGMIQ